MDVNELSLLADYYERGEITRTELRNEIATNELYCDLGSSQHEIDLVFYKINEALIAGKYIEPTAGYASGMKPEAYRITPYGISELKKEIAVIQQNSANQPPMQDRVNDAVKEANKMLAGAHLPLIDTAHTEMIEGQLVQMGDDQASSRKRLRPIVVLVIIAATITAVALVDILLGHRLLGAITSWINK